MPTQSTTSLVPQRIARQLTSLARRLMIAMTIIGLASICRAQDSKNAGGKTTNLVGKPTRLLRHYATSNAVACSSDGRLIASAGATPENWIRIWDAHSLQQIRVLKGHSNYIDAISFSPDNTKLVSTSFDNTIRIWELSTGREMFQKRDQKSTPHCNAVCFTPDGMQLVGSCTQSNGHFVVWDANTGDEIRKGPHLKTTLLSIAMSPDGKVLLTTTAGNTVRLFDFTTGECIHTIQGPTDPRPGEYLRKAIFSPDGSKIACCGGSLSSIGPGYWRLIDVATKHEVQIDSESTGGLVRLAFSPDGKRLVTGSLGGRIQIWDVQSGKELMGFKATEVFGKLNEVTDVAFSGDGKRIVSSGGDNFVREWDAIDVPLVESKSPVPLLATNGSLVASGQTPTRYLRDVQCVAFSPDGKRAVSGCSDGEIKVWDVATGREINCLQSHLPGLYYIRVNHVAFSPDGKWIASGGDSGILSIWESQTGSRIRSLAPDPDNVRSNGAIRNFRFTPDGSKLLVGNVGPANCFRIWDVSTGEQLSYSHYELKELNEDQAKWFDFSHDGQQFLIATGFATYLYNTSSGKRIREITGAVNTSTTATFNPENTKVFSSDASKIVIVDTASGNQVGIIAATGGSDFRSPLALGLDGQSIAVGGSGGSISLFDATTGQERYKNFDHIGPVLSLALSPDGKTILSGSARLVSDTEREATVRDGEVQLWDASTGNLIRTFSP